MDGATLRYGLPPLTVSEAKFEQKGEEFKAKAVSGRGSEARRGLGLRLPAGSPALAPTHPPARPPARPPPPPVQQESAEEEAGGIGEAGAGVGRL